MDHRLYALYNLWNYDAVRNYIQDAPFKGGYKNSLGYVYADWCEYQGFQSHIVRDTICCGSSMGTPIDTSRLGSVPPTGRVAASRAFDLHGHQVSAAAVAASEVLVQRAGRHLVHARLQPYGDRLVVR